MLKKENLKAYIDELIKEVEEELDESNVTGNVDGYQTPFAFSADRKKDKAKEKSNIDVTGYTKVKDIDEGIITEKQFKGLEGIAPNLSLEKISKDQKLKIIKGVGNIIDFIVPKDVTRNFWQVIGTGKIKKNLSGESYLEGKIINSPMFKSLDDLIKGVNWKSMEERRRFNESVNEAKELKWQDVEVGDSANVTAINKTGVIVKTYGRKFHLKFPNGTTKTYDATDLTFVKNESVNEVSTSFVSGNSGRTITHLDDKKYQLTKDVKGAQIGNYHSVVLPKGSIIYNLPGGVFVNHPSLKDKFSGIKETPNFGFRVTMKPDTIISIEKSSKILESVNEGKSKRPVNRWLELKNDDTMHANKKLAVGLKELKHQLSEVEKFFRWYNQIKTMNELSSDTFWKRTHSHIYKIKERLINIAKTIQEIEK